MEVQFGPNPVDEPNLQYKLQRKIKVFNTTNPLPNRGYNLVTSASKYGIVFIASPDGTLSVYYLQQLIDKECEPKHMSVRLQEKPTHIAVNSDNELLAVTGGQLLSIFRVTDFQNQNVAPALTVKCDVQPSTFVSALQWNPCVPDTIAIAFFDGVLLMCQANTAQVKKVQSKARCICWSPKGKQLVTGNSDGTLTQYKPDLTPAKNIPPPNLFEGAPVEALAVYWISTFQFAVVYKNVTDNSRPGVTIVNTPKAGQPSCRNYEDICYSMGSNRPWYYYLQGIAQWNMILLSSSNSMEIATLSTQDGANWFQWCQSDEARPELPLTDKKQENYPVGITIDTCAIHQLPWGENDVLPHMPLLHVVSHSGLLTLFNIINLNKSLPQVCSPPQQLTLPAAALVSDIPGEAPPQPQAPILVQPKPQAYIQPPQQIQQPVAQHAQPPTPQSIAPSVFSGTAPMNATKIQSFQQIQSQVAAPTPQAVEHKQPEVKPTPPQPQAAPVQVKPAVAPVPKPQPSAQAQEANAAALKAEQERANQELKNMLLKEVNDFQMELYKFALKTRETQIKLQRDINTINANFNLHSLDTEQLRKDCSLEELRGAISQLKLELVRACAVVAEARAHSDAKDLHQWTQADALTTKRVASVKKLAYYVQNQLDQAQKALDYKWNEIASRSPQPGQRMIRPILDDVYQPLVKQQEILSRQQAVLRTLRNTLNECEAAPLFKSTSLLRSTPFRNKDPLSKLTKNILNMSIEPQEKTKESMYTAQKLDALRDMLSNHTTVKIKPINVELRQHLASMRLNYEKSLKEKATAPPEVPKVAVKVEPEVKYVPQPVQPPVNIISNIPKPDLVKQTPITVPSFTPVGNAKMTVPGLSNVARTLFTDEPDPPKPAPFSQFTSLPTATAKPFAFTPAPVTATTNTRSVLKDLLQNKQANIEAKNDANTFMGQKICSPTYFGFSGVPPVTAAPTAVYTSKPISDISNMFNKFQPQAISPPIETKPVITPSKIKQEDTSEVETKPTEIKKDVKITNLFGMKTSTPLPTSVPDVLKSNKDTTPIKSDNNNTIKPIEKLVEKLKENAADKSNENLAQTQKPSENIPKTESVTEIKAETPKEVIKPEPTTTSVTSPSSSTASIFAAANASANAAKPQSVFGAPTTPTTQPSSIFASTTPIPEKPAESKPAFVVTTSSSASSIFGKAVASQSSTTGKTPTGSIFGATSPTTTPSLFSSSSQSIFGTTTTAGATSVFGATTTQSVSSTASSQPSVFSAPTPASVTPATPTPVTPTHVTPTLVSPTPISPTPVSPTSVFGSTITSTEASTTTVASSVFSSSSTTSIFGSSSTQPSSVFATTTTPSQASIFSSNSNTAQSVFGTATATTGSATTASQSLFNATTATTQSIFGSTPSPSQSVFGTAAATSQSSIFGSTPTTAQSVFGATTATSQPSIFGSAATTTQSVFGATTTTTQASVFEASTQASVFGSSTPTSQTSVFGVAPAQPSVFGTPTSTPSVFGSPAQTTQASIFGTPTQTTQASVFGSAPAATDQGGSLFGGSEANLFASASISTTSAPSQTSGGSIFGGSSPGAFGGGSTNIFGGKASFSQTNPSAAAIFGGGAAFAQKPATNFWAGGSNSGSTGFGSTGFGQQATTQASSIFGGTTGGSFSAPSGGAQPFGSPQGSAFGGGDAKPSIFGSPQQQAAPGFGGSPVFGSKPVFGQSAGFGSPTSGSGFGSSFGGFNKSPGGAFGTPAAFGGAATFGGTGFGGTSPSKMFGNQAPTTGFGSPTQSNATFESLATQNTLTFGNLAQTAQQAPAQPTFNTSPSFTGWRG